MDLSALQPLSRPVQCPHQGTDWVTRDPSTEVSLTITDQTSHFTSGRRALVENSPLIRHPTNLTTPTIPVITGEDDPANQTSLVNTETNQFLKEVVDQVTAGDGVGWLKLSRLRKLLEEEQYRTLVLSKLQSSIESKVAPDDHIEDVVRYFDRGISVTYCDLDTPSASTSLSTREC